MNYLAVAFICLMPTIAFPASTTTVQVGGIDLSVPLPEGFAPVLPEMKALNELLDATAFGDNVRLAHLIPEGDVSSALRNEIPEMARSFSLQAQKRTMERAVTKADFAELAKQLVKQNDEIIKNVQKQMPDYLKQADAKLKNIDANLEAMNLSLAPFPAHQQDERVLAYSMLMTTQTPDGPSRLACTASLLHVKARLIFAYAYAPEKELEWTRAASKRWVAEILANNPTPPELAKLEQRGLSLLRGPENTILRNALIGAIIGGIVGLIAQFRRKKKGPVI